MSVRLVSVVAVLGVAVLAATCSSPTTPTPLPPANVQTRIIGITGTLAFGTVPIGSSGTQTITITNTGTAALTVTSFSLPPAIVGAFSASASSGTIAPGGTQTVTMRFTPAAAIDYNGTLSIVGDQTGGSNTIAVSGRGDGLVSLTGIVKSSANNAGIPNATVTIRDCANPGRSGATNGGGAYRIDGLTVSNCNVSATAPGFSEQILGVRVDGANTLNFTLLPPPPPPFSRSGSGDNVFDLPSSVSRVRIVGDYGGSCQNFIVKIAGRLIVNELLGPCSGIGLGRHFEGTFLTSGGVVEITNSSGVSWSFTQVN